MKSFKGILFIVITMVTTAVLWYFATPIVEIHPLNKLSHLVGGLSLSGLLLVFVLSIRSKIIERWFNGLEIVYFYHKFLAVFSLASIILHSQLQDAVPDWDEGRETSLSELAKEFGELGQNGFIFLILVAFFAKRLKYEHWRFIHRLLVIPYAIGLYHTYFSSRYDLFQLSPLGIFTAITTIIGLASAIYMLFIYQRIQFKHKGRITGIQKIGTNAVELEMTLDKKMTFREGQFIFLKIFQKGLEKAPHPFSISGGDGHKVFVTIKLLGDFTKQVNESIQLNTPIAIEGPFGHINFEQGRENQIWVAGGVGITPFLAYLKERSVHHEIELFYSYRGENDAILKSFLEEYAKNNEHFKVNFIDTSKMERLSFENYDLQDNTSIIMCGPVKMIKSLAKQLENKNKDVEITLEAFKFR